MLVEKEIGSLCRFNLKTTIDELEWIGWFVEENTKNSNHRIQMIIHVSAYLNGSHNISLENITLRNF